MNILITGGAGFIGSNLTHKLLSMGHNITILDSLSEQIHGKNPELTSPLYQSIVNKVHFIKASVTDRQAVEKSVIDQEVIVHLAAETGTGQSMYQIERYTHTNSVGTALILDVLANSKHNVKKIVLSSTRALYGEGKYNCRTCGIVYPLARNQHNMDQKKFECICPTCHSEVELLATCEQSKIHPTSVYGISKQNQEDLIMRVCPALGIAPVALRYQNVYGPGQSLSNPYTGILSIFSTRIKNNNEINIFEDGIESRDFVYIDDVIEATQLAIFNEKANGQIFNVGYGSTTTVLQVANQLVQNYNLNVPIKVSGNYRLGDIRHNFADITKIKSKLNFIPKISFSEGSKRFCEWVNKQQVHDDNYDKSIKEMKDKGLFK